MDTEKPTLGQFAAEGRTGLTFNQVQSIAAEIVRQVRQESDVPGVVTDAHAEKATDPVLAEADPLPLSSMDRLRNAETRAARKKLGGLTPPRILEAVSPFLKDGSPNSAYDQEVRARLVLALSRMAGADPAWDQYWRVQGVPAKSEGGHHD